MYLDYSCTAADDDGIIVARMGLCIYICNSTLAAVLVMHRLGQFSVFVSAVAP
jgi:hypothetical protein